MPPKTSIYCLLLNTLNKQKWVGWHHLSPPRATPQGQLKTLKQHLHFQEIPNVEIQVQNHDKQQEVTIEEAFTSKAITRLHLHQSRHQGCYFQGSSLQRALSYYECARAMEQNDELILTISHDTLKEERTLEREEWMERFLSKPPKTLETFRPSFIKTITRLPPPKLQPSISSSTLLIVIKRIAEQIGVGESHGSLACLHQGCQARSSQSNATQHTQCNILTMQGLERESSK